MKKRPDIDPVTRGACIGWRPPSNLRPSAWAAKHVRIQNSERSPHFDPTQTPWLVAPLDCAADDETRVVVMIAPTGSGKSTLAEALIPYIVSEDPGNILYASQTNPSASFWMETRMLPTLRQCEPLRDFWPRDRHKSRKLEVIFPHMALISGGANLANFQEKSCRWLIGDEVWEWDPGLLREFKARHHNRWNRKEYMVSQGGWDESELADEWRKSPMAEFGWKCPECGAAQEFAFDSVRFDKVEDAAGRTDEQATAKTARMECIACRAAFPDTVQVRRQLACSNIGNGAHGYIPRNDNPMAGYAGFHVDALAVWWIPWEVTVAEWLEAMRHLKMGLVDKFRQWHQKRRARFWSESMADQHVEFVRSVDFTQADTEHAAPIENEQARFLTVDCGMGHFWVVVAAWRKGGSSRILFESYVKDTGDESGGNIETVRERYGVAPNHTLIDIGYDQTRVFELMAKFGWIGVKGDGRRNEYRHKLPNGNTVARLYSKTQRARSRSGPIVKYIFLATNPVKDIAHRLITGDGSTVELPSDLSKTFEAHCQAERREMIRDPRTGQETSVWKTRHRDNHLWDCWVYQVGAALVFRLFDDET